ncbi:MAG: arginase family protein, partial [Candidatus Aminicenantales bacterium]
YLVFGGLRDVDPLERELLDRSECQYLSVEDIRSRPGVVDEQMRRLSRLTDVIYIHVDMDVLDPAEVRGHPLTSPEGPTSVELASAIRRISANPKAAALGIASIPFGDRDKEGLSLRAAYRLIEAFVAGAKSR